MNKKIELIDNKKVSSTDEIGISNSEIVEKLEKLNVVENFNGTDRIIKILYKTPKEHKQIKF